jgi:putative ABC transport system substrate-binding protein
MIDRRRFLAAAASLALGPALAQSKREPVRVGWLLSGSRESVLWGLAAFKAGMLALGWKEGEHYVLVERWADNLGMERIAVLAGEIAAAKPAVIVASANGSVLEAHKAAPDVPIVMATGTDPVKWGLAASLARPGGMVTGNANMLGDVSDKYPELLLAAAPGARRIGFLMQNQGPLNQAQLDSIRRIAKSHALDARIGEVKTLAEVDPALARFAAERVQGLIVTVGPLLAATRARISQTALKRKWPMIGFSGQFADEGALMSYGPNIAAQFERAAYFVDRILKGAKPADLPFEQPTQIEFVLNMKTARALGLKIPQELLLRATRVIE